MKKKQVLLIVFIVTILFPLYQGIYTGILLYNVEAMGEVKKSLVTYQISIWLSWVIMAALAVHFKWTRKSNFFFRLLYIFLVLGFGIFGFLTQEAVSLYEFSSGYNDSYTLGVFTAIQHTGVAAVLTIFLQISVRFFETQWHRR